MEFVKGKPKGTNPAIMGNPIDMYAANGSKKHKHKNNMGAYLLRGARRALSSRYIGL